MKNRYALFIVLFLIQLSLPFIGSADVGDLDPIFTPTSSRFRLTYENVSLPENEKMGFLGGTFLYDLNAWFSVGGASYGALTGERGGFITLGVATEFRNEINRYSEINAGLFVGAGGGRGGYNLSGGGLMLRYHLGGQIKLDGWGNIGAGISYIDFPDGTISSFQPYVSYDYPFSTLIAPSWINLPVRYNSRTDQHVSLSQAEQEFFTVYRSYSMPSGVLADNGSPQHNTINLLGAQWNRYLNDNLFVKIESEGAMGGQSNGFMQIFLGLGYRMPIFENTFLKLSSSLGVAGGGNVATGGGFLIDADLSLQQRLFGNLFAEVSAGYVTAPETSFEALSVAGKIGYRFSSPDFEKNDVSLYDLAGFKPLHLRIRTTHQSYFKADPNWRTHHSDENVDLLGFQGDYFFRENFYFSGQGLAAYKGMAGAYMTGMVGGGLHFPLFETPLFLDVEGLFGAAGGGGLQVGGGLVWQANGGLGYQITDKHSLIVSYGYMNAPKGQFKANVLSLAYAYNFSFFTNK